MDNENKLPVFQTFGNALGFAFGNYFTVLRLAWLPFTLFLLAQVAIGHLVTSMAIHTSKPLAIFNRFGDLLYVQAVLWVLQLIVLAAIAVSVHRVILFGDRRPGVYFSFRFGRTEFAYALMALLWALMIFVILAAAIAPVILILSQGDVPGFIARIQDAVENWPRDAEQIAKNMPSFALVWVAYTAGWLTILYVSLRLCLWPPSVVATNRLSPSEPWGLTRGNVLRLLGLFALTIIVCYVVLGIIAGVGFAVAFQSGLVDLSGPAKDEAAEISRQLTAPFDPFGPLLPYAPLIWLAVLLFYSFAIGLSVALISYAYKALKGYDAKEPIPDAA
jgi:hypothetical protein